MNRRVTIIIGLLVLILVSILVVNYSHSINDQITTRYYNQSLQEAARIYGTTRRIIGLHQQDEIDKVNVVLGETEERLNSLPSNDQTKEGEMIIDQLLATAYDFLAIEQEAINGQSDYKPADSFKALETIQIKLDELEKLIYDLEISIDLDALEEVITSVSDE